MSLETLIRLVTASVLLLHAGELFGGEHEGVIDNYEAAIAALMPYDIQVKSTDDSIIKNRNHEKTYNRSFRAHDRARSPSRRVVTVTDTVTGAVQEISPVEGSPDQQRKTRPPLNFSVDIFYFLNPIIHNQSLVELLREADESGRLKRDDRETETVLMTGRLSDAVRSENEVPKRLEITLSKTNGYLPTEIWIYTMENDVRRDLIHITNQLSSNNATPHPTSGTCEWAVAHSKASIFTFSVDPEKSRFGALDQKRFEQDARQMPTDESQSAKITGWNAVTNIPMAKKDDEIAKPAYTSTTFYCGHHRDHALSSCRSDRLRITNLSRACKGVRHVSRRGIMRICTAGGDGH